MGDELLSEYIDKNVKLPSPDYTRWAHDFIGIGEMIMSWYLVLFDETAGNDINADGSEYFLNEHMVEANSPTQAVKNVLAALFVDDYDVKHRIKEKLSEGASVVELGTVKPTINRVNFNHIKTQV